MFGTGGEGGDIFVVLGLVSRRGPFRTRGAIESSNILVQIKRTTPDLIWSSISKTYLNLSWDGNLTWGLGWQEILTFHSTFAFLRRKRFLCTKACSGWWPLVGSGIQTKRSAESLQQSFLHWFPPSPLSERAFRELEHLKCKCKLMLWTFCIFIRFRLTIYPFEVEWWTFSL